MTALMIVLVCLLLNAVLSCTEMAFVTVDPKILRKKILEGDKRAIYIEAMQQFPERILSVIQIGITLVAIISGAVSGAGAKEKIAPVLMSFFSITENTAEILSIVLVVAPLTFLSVIIGELVPKNVAIRYALPICLYASTSLRVAEKTLGALVKPMGQITNFLTDLIIPGSKKKVVANQEGEHVSLKGLKRIHKQYVRNLIDLDSKTVKTIMIDWQNVDSVRSDADQQEVMDKILTEGYTRIPVIDSEEVYGFVHAKEFMTLSRSGAGDNWLSFVRATLFIVPQMKLLTALRLMQRQKIHLLVVGTPEKPMGIITLEDILEEVVGDITDEDEDQRFEHSLRHFRAKPELNDKQIN